MKITRISKRFNFSAAHWLENQALPPEEQKKLFGKCSGLREHCDKRLPHGHTYFIDVELEGPVREDSGMVVNFNDVKEVVKREVIQYYDHKCLNEEVSPYCSGVIPTAENMAAVIFNRLSVVWNGNPIKLVSVTVWEGPGSCAKITEK